MLQIPPFENAERWMSLALELAREAEVRDEVPIGALLVRNDEILGRGYNLREETQSTAGHAEMLALADFNSRYQSWRLPPGTLLVATIEPCLMCTGALLAARADFIGYGCADTKNAGLLRVKDQIETGVFDHRFKEIRGGIRESECRQIISSYFKTKRL